MQTTHLLIRDLRLPAFRVCGTGLENILSFSVGRYIHIKSQIESVTICSLPSIAFNELANCFYLWSRSFSGTAVCQR